MGTQSDSELLRAIGEKLDMLLGATAIQGKDIDAQIRILYGLGFDSFKIAPLVGISPDSVRKRKAKLKLRSKG